MNSLEILDKKAQLKERAYKMIENCKVEIRNFNQKETDELNAIKEEIAELNKELRNLDIELSSDDTNKFINSKKIRTMEKNFSLIMVHLKITKFQFQKRELEY